MVDVTPIYTSGKTHFEVSVDNVLRVNVLQGQDKLCSVKPHLKTDR